MDYDEAIMEFRADFIGLGENIHGSNGLNSFDEPQKWLEWLNLVETGQIDTRLPSTTFIMARDDKKIIGICDIRHYLNEKRYYYGHIGLSIAPDMRGRGYAKQLTYFAIQKAAELGIAKIIISCDDDNGPSRRNIEGCGFTLSEIHTEEDGNKILIYNLEVIKDGITYLPGIVPTIEDLLTLYASVHWTAYTGDPERLQRSVARSLCVYTAWDNGKLIGLARAVGDGEHILLIQDLLILPDYQRRGIGKQLLGRILTSYNHIWMRILNTDGKSDAPPFYEHLGFVPLSEYNISTYIFPPEKILDF